MMEENAAPVAIVRAVEAEERLGRAVSAWVEAKGASLQLTAVRTATRECQRAAGDAARYKIASDLRTIPDLAVEWLHAAPGEEDARLGALWTLAQEFVTGKRREGC